MDRCYHRRADPSEVSLDVVRDPVLDTPPAGHLCDAAASGVVTLDWVGLDGRHLCPVLPVAIIETLEDPRRLIGDETVAGVRVWTRHELRDQRPAGDTTGSPTGWVTSTLVGGREVDRWVWPSMERARLGHHLVIAYVRRDAQVQR